MQDNKRAIALHSRSAVGIVKITRNVCSDYYRVSYRVGSLT